MKIELEDIQSVVQDKIERAVKELDKAQQGSERRSELLGKLEGLREINRWLIDEEVELTLYY